MSPKMSLKTASKLLAISIRSGFSHMARYLSKDLKIALLIVPVKELIKESSFIRILLSASKAGNHLVILSITLTNISCRLSLFSLCSKAGKLLGKAAGFLCKIIPRHSDEA
jgi:hypothetical protein